jgi:hypothetical protein
MSDSLHKRPPRFELKFVIPIATATSLWRDIAPHCLPDEYGDPDNGYEVASSYYDTTRLRFHYDREESVGYRRKVRLRAYVESGQCVGLFFEIKEKHKHRVGKKRCALSSWEILQSYSEHHRIPVAALEPFMPEQHVASREILFLDKHFSLVPTILIRYIRKTLVGKYDSGLRITFDYRVTAGGSSFLKFNDQEEQFIVEPHSGILEVKTFGTLPLWLQHALLKHEISRTRFSKYCEGVIVSGNPVVNAPLQPLLEQDSIPMLQPANL